MPVQHSHPAAAGTGTLAAAYAAEHEKSSTIQGASAKHVAHLYSGSGCRVSSSQASPLPPGPGEQHTPSSTICVRKVWCEMGFRLDVLECMQGEPARVMEAAGQAGDDLH